MTDLKWLLVYYISICIYGHEFMNVVIFNNAPTPPEVKFKHDIEYINVAK